MEFSSSTPYVGSARVDHRESTRWPNLAVSRVPLCLPGAPTRIVLPIHHRPTLPSASSYREGGLSISLPGS